MVYRHTAMGLRQVLNKISVQKRPSRSAVHEEDHVAFAFVYVVHSAFRQIEIMVLKGIKVGI
jgi:hypothetical protein